MSDILEEETNNLLDNEKKNLDLDNDQKDTLGEIGNISMGTAATTLSTLLKQKVLITTPSIKIMNWNEISSLYNRPCVGVKIDYTLGLKGTNVLILKDKDTKIISNLMMGNTENIDEEEDITDIDLSAIGEAMNQMIGSASTSLASIINEKIDIDVPSAFKLDFEDDKFFDSIGFGEDGVVAIIFRMQVGSLIDSEIMQLLPKEFAIDISNKIRNDLIDKELTKNEFNETKDTNNEEKFNSLKNNSDNINIQENKINSAKIKKSINAQPVQFQNFDTEFVEKQKENIDILMDVPLEVTVELGKTSKKIKEILEFSPGTIIELDKLAGEPIDILVNGKYVAKGEVVVIDENFAIRVTTIINSEFRI